MNEELLKKIPKDELFDYFLSLHKVATALLSADGPINSLSVVVETAMEFMKADGGSLYLAKKPGQLDFQVCLNKSFHLPFNPTALPLNAPSIATYCFKQASPVSIADVYLLNAEDPYEFNISLDNHINYRTKSTLATPIMAKDGRTIGVLQLFNRKNFAAEAWPKEELRVLEMPAFGIADIELIKLFAELASAAMERYLKGPSKNAA